MMGPASHFLFGALCGSAIGGLVVVARRRWLPLLPPLVLACGFWAELPLLLGFGHVTHWSANLFFGYVWLHREVWSSEAWALTVVVALGALMCAAYAVSLTWYFWTVDTVRWERGLSRPRRSTRGKREP